MLMVLNNVLNFALILFLFFEVLIIDFVHIISTCSFCFIGKPHLYFLSLLFENKRAYCVTFWWRFSCFMTFFGTVNSSVGFIISFWRIISTCFEGFLFFCHRRFVECFHYCVFHHERCDFIFKIRFSKVH